VLVDVHEVEEGLDELAVVEVPVPALRRDAPGLLRLGDRVPHVHVLQLRPHVEVRVRDIEHPVGSARPEPWIVQAQVDAVAVEPDDELLPGAHAQALAVAGEPGLGLRDEAGRLGLDLAPALVFSEELGEGEEREAVGLELVDDSLLHVVEARTRVGELLPARPVRERAIVERVRGTDPAGFEGGRHAVDARGEACLRPVHHSLR
jgi:hypothetical protein